MLFAKERKFLKVLEKNEELRYAGGGLIGLGNIRQDNVGRGRYSQAG